MVRQFGYGVPNLSRALASSANDLAIIAESSIKPFKQFKSLDPKTGKETKSIGLNEAHYYPLPWPKELLDNYYSHDVSLKVTLSWFVEPNPGALGSRYPKVYRNYGLKFDLQRPNEILEKFKARINASEPQNDEPAVQDDANWCLGAKHSRAGSLISDVWTGPIASLLMRRYLCVSPREGWWKSRTKDGRFNDTGRYCLIVSLSAPTLPVDIYTALEQSIRAAVEAEISVEATDA